MKILNTFPSRLRANILFVTQLLHATFLGVTALFVVIVAGNLLSLASQPSAAGLLAFVENRALIAVTSIVVPCLLAQMMQIITAQLHEWRWGHISSLYKDAQTAANVATLLLTAVASSIAAAALKAQSFGMGLVFAILAATAVCIAMVMGFFWLLERSQPKSTIR